jgi:hypothetical protein
MSASSRMQAAKSTAVRLSVTFTLRQGRFQHLPTIATCRFPITYQCPANWPSSKFASIGRKVAENPEIDSRSAPYFYTLFTADRVARHQFRAIPPLIQSRKSAL